MSGKTLTDQQIRLYMNARKTGNTQRQASAKASLSERSARRIDQGEISANRQRRYWRTRKDPLNGLWEQVIEPRLSKDPELMPQTLHEYLCDHHSETYDPQMKRTLQRRIKRWRVQYGPEKEVMFRQQKIPGELGLSDFTQLKGVEICLGDEVFDHRLYHYRLAYSGWCFVKVILGGESFSALSAGLQDALWRCGGVPTQHRTDSLSAAFNNHSTEQKFSEQYAQLCRHYGLKATRNNVGKSHENGAIESPHGHLKRRIEQALILRGSNHFTDLASYQLFLDAIVAKINRQNKSRFDEERIVLSDLPKHRTQDYSDLCVSVTRSSTITVKRVLYTVPSRLIGERLRVHLHDDRLVLYCGHQCVHTMPRLYVHGAERGRCINYRHVIHALVKKPQAFRGSHIRDDLLPNADYQAIWQHVDRHLDPKQACKYIVTLLHLAAQYDCEQALGRYVYQSIRDDSLVSLDQCRERFGGAPEHYPLSQSQQHSLSDYDACIIQASQEASHD